MNAVGMQTGDDGVALPPMRAQSVLYLTSTHSLQVLYEESLTNVLEVGHEPKRGQAAPGAATAFQEAIPTLFSVSHKSFSVKDLISLVWLEEMQSDLICRGKSTKCKRARQSWCKLHVLNMHSLITL